MTYLMPSLGSTPSGVDDQNKITKRTLITGSLAIAGAVVSAVIILNKMDYTAETTSSALAAIPEHIFNTCITQRCIDTQSVKSAFLEAESCKDLFSRIHNLKAVSTHPVYGLKSTPSKFLTDMVTAMTLEAKESSEHRNKYEDCSKLLQTTVFKNTRFDDNQASLIMDLIRFDESGTNRFDFVKIICDTQFKKLNPDLKIGDQGSAISLVELALKMNDSSISVLLSDPNYYEAIASSINQAMNLGLVTLEKYGIYPNEPLEKVNKMKEQGLNYEKHQQIMDAVFAKAYEANYISLVAALARNDVHFLDMLKSTLFSEDFELVEQLLNENYSNPELN